MQATHTTNMHNKYTANTATRSVRIENLKRTRNNTLFIIGSRVKLTKSGLEQSTLPYSMGVYSVSYKLSTAYSLLLLFVAMKLRGRRLSLCPRLRATDRVGPTVSYGDSRGPKLQHTRRTLKVHGVRATEPVGRKDSAPRAHFFAQRRSFGDISTATRLAPQSRTTDALTAPCVRAGVATVLLCYSATAFRCWWPVRTCAHLRLSFEDCPCAPAAAA